MNQPLSTPVEAFASAALFADSEFVRQRLAGFLGAEGFAIAAEGRNLAELSDETHGQLDVVLLELEPRKEGRATLESARRAFGDTPILVLAAGPDTRMCRECLRLGASGIIDLDEAEETLGPTVRAAAAGLVCFPSVIRRHFAPPVLSNREKQILGMVVLGFTNGQIARKLHLAESTVKSHLSSTFGKLGVRSRNEATSMILDPERGLGIGVLAMPERDELIVGFAGESATAGGSTQDDAQTTAILDSKVRVTQNVAYRKLAHETVVLDLKTGKYFALNETAARILEVLERAANPRTAAAVLATEYARPEAEVQADVVAFCVDLLARELIELVEARAKP